LSDIVIGNLFNGGSSGNYLTMRRASWKEKG